ncbi:putative ankyrin-repeat protein [Pestalotiopsis sp. IQ-011]
MTLLEGDVELADNKGQTPLHLAALNGQCEVVKELVQIHGNLANLRDEPDHMPIHLRNGKGETPILSAVRRGNIDIYEFLIEQGANVDDVNNNGAMPLHAAVQSGNFEMTNTLLEANADSSGKAPLNELLSLFQAAEGSQLEIVKLLLEAGAVANAPERNGETALHTAAEHNLVHMAKLLINAGGDPNARWSSRTKSIYLGGDTPLHSAARQGNMDMANLLLEAGASVNTPDDNGDTPLHKVGNFRKVDMTKLLLKAGAYVNAQNKVGSSPLAAVECVEVLLQRGADVNITDMNKRTALHEAAKLNRIHAMELLIRGGADVNVVDIDGQTALDVFLDAQHESAAGASILSALDVSSAGADTSICVHAIARYQPLCGYGVSIKVYDDVFFAYKAHVSHEGANSDTWSTDLGVQDTDFLHRNVGF